MYFIQHCFICRTSDPLCLKMLGLNPGLLQLWHWQSDALDLIHQLTNSARSHPQSVRYHPKTRLDLIHNSGRSIHTRLDLVHNGLDFHPQAWLDLIHTRLDLMRLDIIPIRLDLIHTWLDLTRTQLDLIHIRPDLIHTLDKISSTTRLDLI